MTHMVRKIKMDVAWRLLHIDLFGEIAMKKGIFSINLMYRPVLRDINAKNGTNSSMFNDRVDVSSKSRPSC